jgi:hypothetical protein
MDLRYILLLLLFPLTSYCQEVEDEFPIAADSVLLQQGQTPVPDIHLTVPSGMTDSLAAQAVQVIKTRRMHRSPDPTRALWLALVIPGAGQIYNHKYWKLPIIYGGFMGCAYALSWNNMMLRDYSQAYLDIMDSDPNTKSYEKMLPLNYRIEGREDQFKEIFKNKKNYFRKYRDMSIFAFIGVYVVSVIDAYVDAELSSFDISEDLSLQVVPAVISSQPSSPASTLRQRTPSSLCHETGLGMAVRLHF